MMVEHAFVTTLEAGPALDEASWLLKGLGFELEEQSERTLVSRKGVRNPARARSVGALPQRMRLEFDRGRIQVAASIEEHRKAGDFHRALLLALVHVLESRLAHRTPLEEAMAPWQDLVEQLAFVAARRRRNARVMSCVLILFILAIAAVIGWAVME